MSTSGTVSTTVITVQNLIDSGARRAGKLAEELTVEQVAASKQSLYYLLSNLVNRGIQYWCIQKNVIGLTPDKYINYLPVGTNDVLNSNYRTVTQNTTGGYSSSGNAANAFDGQYTNICQLSDNVGYIGINNGAGSQIYMGTVGILPAVSGSVTLTIQYSTDNSTWIDLYAPGATTWAAGTWIYYDLDPSATASYWRIKQSAGVNMGVYQVVFGSNATEIPLARLNRDDYTNLPNKNFTSSRPLQYWFDRNIPQPAMYLWPSPSSYAPQLVVWCHRYVQDVGALSGSIEIPQRWYLAIQNMLAHQMAMELPAVEPARIQYCELQAEKYWQQAEQEERDKSPIYFAPNISPYTR
jgi:hypothetical protein